MATKKQKGIQISEDGLRRLGITIKGAQFVDIEEYIKIGRRKYEVFLDNDQGRERLESIHVYLSPSFGDYLGDSVFNDCELSDQKYIRFRLMYELGRQTLEKLGPESGIAFQNYDAGGDGICKNIPSLVKDIYSVDDIKSIVRATHKFHEASDSIRFGLYARDIADSLKRNFQDFRQDILP